MAKEQHVEELKRPERVKPLCWRRSVNDEYCDRPEGHAGRCSWEAEATITKLYQDLRSNRH